MKTTFRLSDTPAQNRLDLVRQMMEDTIAPLEINPSVGAALMDDEMAATQVGPIRLTEHKVSAAEVRRTTRSIRRSDPGLCKIDILVGGQLVVEQGHRQTQLRPGDLALVNLSHPCRWVGSAARFVALTLPRADLSLRDAELVRLAAEPIPADKGIGALVATMALRIASDTKGYSAAVAAGVGGSILDLLQLTLTGHIGRAVGVPPETRQDILLMRIHTYIEERLADPALSPATVAATHHISVRYLQMLFQVSGVGVATWIRRRRLDRCSRDLRDPLLRLRPVNAIGARWGYPDPAQFNRVFRSAYGVPPGAYRRSWQLQNFS